MLLNSEPATVARLPAVEVDNLWVRYKTSYEKKPTFRKTLIKLGRRQRTMASVEAVRGVTFEVPPGVVLGIVGSNGAGKSTLLRAIAGILPPSEGCVTVRGRIATLLALGVGFRRELTGRDNVLLSGLAYGFSVDEINEKFDEIAEFSELGEKIDASVRTYSRGMQGRLGFSVAVHLDSDILLVDEALSAGDASFKQKCLDKMDELTAAEHRTVLIVSHGLSVLEGLAQEVLWMENGDLHARGPAGEIIESYMRSKNIHRRDVAMEDV